jgi:hypothetical protein
MTDEPLLQENPAFLKYYDPSNIEVWLKRSPLSVLSGLNSEIRTRNPVLIRCIAILLEHPNIDVVTTFDDDKTGSLKTRAEHIMTLSHKIQKHCLVSMGFQAVCLKDKSKIIDENNNLIDLNFEVAGHRFDAAQFVLQNWVVWPSPLAVLYATCTNTIALCEEIQAITVPILQHDAFLTEHRLDRTEKVTLRFYIEAFYHEAAALKRVARVGLVYREAFLGDQVQIPPKE